MACDSIFIKHGNFRETAETWAIIKALEEIKIASTSKYIILQTHVQCSSFTIYEAGTSLDLGW